MASIQNKTIENGYRKIPKISPGLHFSKALFEGLMYGRKFAFQNRLGLLVVGRKFTISALFYFVFVGNFQIQVPRGDFIRRSDLTEGFLRYDFSGLIFGWTYTWTRLFSEFYGIHRQKSRT